MKLSLMLVGRSGSGKTRVMETLSGSEVKKPRDVQFVARFGSEFQAKETYGFYSNDRDLQTCIKDLEMCVNSFPGINIIGFVIRLGRFTPEERDMINILRDTLGEIAFNFTIVIFTNLDSLIYDHVPLSEFLEESPQELQDLLRLCGGRYVGFDNTGSEEDKQGYARSLIEAMKALQIKNESDKYSVEMLEEARSATFATENEKKEMEQNNIRLLKEQIKRDIRTEVETKIRRELDDSLIAQDITPGWDNNKGSVGVWNRGRRELDDKRYAEEMPYSKQQGSRQPENMPYSKEQVRGQLGNMLYSKEEVRGQPEDMSYSREQNRGQPEDMPYFQEQGRGQPGDMPYSKEQGRGKLGDKPEQGQRKPERRWDDAIEVNMDGTKPYTPSDEGRGPKSRHGKNKPELKPKPAHLKARGKEKNKRPSVWVCIGCFEHNDNDNKSCSGCGKTRTIPLKHASKEIGRPNTVYVESNLPTPATRPVETSPGGVKKQTLPADAGKKTEKVQPLIKNGVDKHEQRLVLIGKTGVGKSATANTIHGAEIFKAKTSPKSVTEKCQSERSERLGKKLLLVDTPGFFDTSTSRRVIETEVKKCIGISAPGPHAFLLVMSIRNRFTKEERYVLKEIRDMFGEEMINYLIVVFTGRDEFEGSSSIDHLIKEHIMGYPADFRGLVQKAGGGYVTFNNRAEESEKEHDVQNLLIRIDEMVKRNGGGHFTSEMFEAAEKVIQQRIAKELEAKKEEIRKEVEDEIRKELEKEMKGKHAELSNLKKLREEDLLQYEILKKKLDKEYMKNKKKNETERDLEGELRPLIVKRMSTKAENKLIQQIEKCEGPERAEVHRQLANVGQEIQQLFQRKHESYGTGAPEEEEEEALNRGAKETEANELQENADRATEKYLVELRDKERKDIETEKGTWQKIKEKISGIFSPFLSLFKYTD